MRVKKLKTEGDYYAHCDIHDCPSLPGTLDQALDEICPLCEAHREVRRRQLFYERNRDLYTTTY